MCRQHVGPILQNKSLGIKYIPKQGGWMGHYFPLFFYVSRGNIIKQTFYQVQELRSQVDVKESTIRELRLQLETSQSLQIQHKSSQEKIASLEHIIR